MDANRKEKMQNIGREDSNESLSKIKEDSGRNAPNLDGLESMSGQDHFSPPSKGGQISSVLPVPTIRS